MTTTNVPAAAPFTAEANTILVAARNMARRFDERPSHGTTDRHILLALLDHPDCAGAKLLVSLRKPLDELRKAALRTMQPVLPPLRDAPVFSAAARFVTAIAPEEARLRGASSTGSDHLLAAIARANFSGAEALIQPDDLYPHHLRTALTNDAAQRPYFGAPGSAPSGIHQSPSGWAPTLSDLVDAEMLPAEAAEFLDSAARSGCSFLVAGPVRAGKTTMLGALGRIPGLPDERIVTVAVVPSAPLAAIEEQHQCVVSLLAQPSSLRGEIRTAMKTFVDLMQVLRPTRGIVDGVHGAEALPLLQFAAGESRSAAFSLWTTGGASGAVATLLRLAEDASPEITLAQMERLIAQAGPIIVVVGQYPDGTRRVVEIAEVAPGDGDALTSLWASHSETELKHSGARSRHSERISNRGFAPGNRGWLAAEVQPR